MSIQFQQTIPIFRMFDVAKAKEFYIDYLGFTIDWEHRFEPNLPLYMQISRGGLSLHLSEHHGDSTPGSICYVRMTGVEEFHREISAKGYNYLRPGLQTQEWGTRDLNVTDPFGNRIRFSEQL